MGEEVKPGEVTISGEPEVLEAIDALSTEILDIEGATDNVVRELKLQDKEDIRLSPGQSSLVQVLVRIERIIDRPISISDIELRNLPDDLEANLNENEEVMTLTVRGPQSLVNAFKPEDLKVYMDLENTSRVQEPTL